LTAIGVFTMDINELRIFFTLASFFCFLAIVAWAYSDKSKKGFEEAANLPFNDPEEEALARRALILGQR
jgi:cytochrome c oxidase cbb3-type subunit 4